MYYRNLECCNTAVWMFNRDRNFKVQIDFTVVHNFQDSRVLTLIPWRHSHEFSDGSRNNYMWGPSQFSSPITPNSLLPRTGWVGAPKLTLPRERETLGTPLGQSPMAFLTMLWTAIDIFKPYIESEVAVVCKLFLQCPKCRNCVMALRCYAQWWALIMIAAFKISVVYSKPDVWANVFCYHVCVPVYVMAEMSI